MTWLYVPPVCVQATEDSTAASSSPDPTIVLWSLLSGKPTPQPYSWPGWKSRPWIERLSGIRLKPSTADRGVAQWISSLQDGHAHPYPSQVSEPVRMTNAGYGTTSTESSARFNRPTCSSKTCPACSLPADDAFDAYVAGLIDGEGSIVIGKGTARKYVQFVASVSIEMSTKAVHLLHLLLRYGGAVKSHHQGDARHSPTAAWRIYGPKMVCFLGRIAPRLLLKRSQAEIVLALYERTDERLPNGTTKWTPDRIAAWEKARERVLLLNRRGPIPPAPNEIAQLVGERWVKRTVSLFGEQWETFSGPWPRAGGVLNGTASLRQPSAPRTSVIESSYSLPTPSASRYGSNRGGAAGRVGKDRPSLVTMGLRGLLPTPTATDCKASGAAAYSTESGRHAGVTLTDAVVRRLPTPRACEARTPGNTERHPSLVGMAKAGLLPTPSARDWKSGGASQETLDRNARPLNEVITSGDASLRLSPRFVEWMMGLPANWTEIGPTGSTSLETESYPKRPRKRGARSRRASGKVNDE